MPRGEAEIGFFHQLPTEKHYVQVGEPEGELVPSENAKLLLRIQAIEQVLSRIPIAGWDYQNELSKVGLKKLDVKL